MKVYDPRINNFIESNNPALILADIITFNFSANNLAENFWDSIKEMADYYDEKEYVLIKKE